MFFVLDLVIKADNVWFENGVHRHWEDLLRIEKQQGKAGSGKRYIEFPWKTILSQVLCVVNAHFRQDLSTVLSFYLNFEL